MPAARGKRKRETMAAPSASATICDESRIVDPYGLSMRPCKLSDHHKKKNKTTVVVCNCAENPNCLFGLGEHQEGIWQGKKLVQKLLGDDPRELTLFTNVAFRKAVYEWEPKQQNANDQQALQMRALQKLFGLMQLGKKAIYDPHEFASTLSLNSVLQQDVQEFSKLLLTHLRMIFSQSRISDHWNLVDRIFQGQMSYVTKCLRCKTKSERLSSYYEITITLQLMRFVYDAQAGRKKKLMDVIEVNETLNMTDILRRTGSANAFNESNDAIYRLAGYLNHRGKTTHAGHYTASVAYPKPDDASNVDWFEFDDSIVNNMTSIVDTEGSKERTGKILRSRDAYMLLYRKLKR
uniref:ubiquitinyl hydrolase 1 n=1 Tax=Globisporangium ultimum (strain ATCC 200006 / CBS 805.95 / DAOM BR144) TaxID=431595 RepID=K3WLH3_GLOUD